MSDPIGHECGLACVRLKKPLDYYVDRFNDPFWGLRKLYLLMEKQRNRGQDGAGIAVARFDMPPGDAYLVRYRSLPPNPIDAVFRHAMRHSRRLRTMLRTGTFNTRDAKHKIDFLGEVHIGHLRYGTHGGYSVKRCQPYVRRNNQPSRNLAIAGNFNMTNARELFDKLVEIGLHPVGESDTQVVLERIAFSLDQEHDRLHLAMGPGSLANLEGEQLNRLTSNDLDVARVLRKASRDWDGGYAFAGIIGNGDAFVCRDPAGIRPGFWYEDEDVVATASERSALVTAFRASPSDIREIEPAHALIMKRDGRITMEQFAEPLPAKPCSFERIYFSRGNDQDIYQERKTLGRTLAPRVLDAVQWDLERTVFSFIPNTAEVAFLGLTQEIEHLALQRATANTWDQIQKGTLTHAALVNAMAGRPRVEKIAHKDQKLRTFIHRTDGRADLVSHVYDITPGIVTPADTLVVLDDSIVRGTTLRDSIITMLARLEPKRIMIVSSAPPICYPDCYGIDMSQLGKFIAWEAAVSLLNQRGESRLLKEVEDRCRDQEHLPPERMKNHVRTIYDRFTLDELSAEVAQLVRKPDLAWQGRIDVLFQTVAGLQNAMPEHAGDWCFTGNYPTPGGYRVLNTAYLHWVDRVDMRAY
ncbi:MAG: amidophosphoribosyltransferase [Phycisphaerales bacterium]